VAVEKRCGTCGTTFEGSFYCPRCRAFVADPHASSLGPGLGPWVGQPGGPGGPPVSEYLGPGPHPEPGPARLNDPSIGPTPAAGAAWADGSPPCRQCGGGPTATVTFSQGIGMLFARRQITLPGSFCRDCGRHYGRDLLVKTFITGWWGVFSFFLNFGNLFADIGGLMKVGRLAPPQGGDPGMRKAPGSPTFLRPAFLLACAIYAAGAVFLLRPHDTTSSKPFQAHIGDCVHYAGGDKVTFVSCRSAHDGRAIALEPSEELCPPAADASISEYDDGTGRVLCIDEGQ